MSCGEFFFKGILRTLNNLKEFKGILVVFGYLTSIFKLFQNIAVRIFFNSPVANNQIQSTFIYNIVGTPALLATN